MIYKKFRIKNFKGIDEVEVNLENNRIITLVGLNESGKTTIMDAIALFFKMIKGDDPNTAKLNEFRPKGIDFTGNIEIEGTLFFGDDDIKKIEKFWQDLGKENKLDIPKEFSYTYKFNFDLHMYKNTERICGFNVKTQSAKRDLHNTDNESWQKLIEFIKENLVPEILYYDDFIFRIPAHIRFVKQGVSIDQEVSDKDNKIWQSEVSDKDNKIWQSVIGQWDKKSLISPNP